MTEALQHLQHAAGDAEGALNGLVGIGVGAEGDWLRLIAGTRQFAFQQFGQIRLEHQPGLEIEAGRHADIGMRRARIAVDAAMLATAVWVQRAVEADIRALVPRHRGFRPLGDELGRQGRQLAEFGGQRAPAIVPRFRPRGLVAHRRVGHGAAAARAREGRPETPPSGMVAPAIFPVRSHATWTGAGQASRTKCECASGSKGCRW